MYSKNCTLGSFPKEWLLFWVPMVGESLVLTTGITRYVKHGVWQAVDSVWCECGSQGE